jgi:hypothetical protein
MAITFKTLNTTSISAGAYKEVDWTPDKDIVIKAVLVNERDDKSLANVQAYLSISDVPFTKDFVPASAIGQDLEFCWKPNLAVAKGSKIYAKFTNSSSAAVNIDIVFMYE